MRKLADEILDTVAVGALATINRDRTPLVTPLHFVRLGDKVVWISDREARHSHNVFRTGQAEFVVWDEQKRAVYLKSTVGELPEAETEQALEAYRNKHGDFMPEFEKSQIYYALIGEIDENSTTETWLHFVA